MPFWPWQSQTAPGHLFISKRVMVRQKRSEGLAVFTHFLARVILASGKCCMAVIYLHQGGHWHAAKGQKIWPGYGPWCSVIKGPSPTFFLYMINKVYRMCPYCLAFFPAASLLVHIGSATGSLTAATVHWCFTPTNNGGGVQLDTCPHQPLQLSPRNCPFAVVANSKISFW